MSATIQVHLCASRRLTEERQKSDERWGGGEELEWGGKGFIHGLGTYATRSKIFLVNNTTDEKRRALESRLWFFDIDLTIRAGRVSQVVGTYIERFEGQILSKQ